MGGAAAGVMQGTLRLRSWLGHTSEQHSESVAKCPVLLLSRALKGPLGPKRRKKRGLTIINALS